MSLVTFTVEVEVQGTSLQVTENSDGVFFGADTAPLTGKTYETPGGLRFMEIALPPTTTPPPVPPGPPLGPAGA